MRSVVFGLNDLYPGLAAFPKNGIDIADIANDLSRLPRSGFERLPE
jgi:hypothetical protein